jgi:hypothetical protein
MKNLFSAVAIFAMPLSCVFAADSNFLQPSKDLLGLSKAGKSGTLIEPVQDYCSGSGCARPGTPPGLTGRLHGRFPSTY